MAGFTAPTAGVDVQSVSFNQEIHGAYVERRLAVGDIDKYNPATFYNIDDVVDSHVVLPGIGVLRCIWPSPISRWEPWEIKEGNDLQGRLYGHGVGTSDIDWAGWRTIQEWLDNNCTSFVNHTIDLTTVGIPTMFTTTTWRDVAGIDSSGWKRSTTGTWTGDYGYMQTGDVIGPWIYDELQAGLSALKWTKKGSDIQDTARKTAYEDGIYTTCDVVLAAYKAEWIAAGWIADGYPSYYTAYYLRNHLSRNNSWIFEGRRRRARPTVSGIPDVTFNHTSHVYLLAGKWASDVDFEDIDGVTNGLGKLFLIEDFAASTNTSEVGALYGNSEVDPNPSTCPVVEEEYERGIECVSAWWIFKWSFSHSD